MHEKYEALVADLKDLEQEGVILPMAEDEWYTRPDTVSYGIVQLDFEADALQGDDVKSDRAWEGSVDLFSLAKSGAGWVQMIENALTKHCDGCWSLNRHTYERETSLTHWEWVFQTEE